MSKLDCAGPVFGSIEGEGKSYAHPIYIVSSFWVDENFTTKWLMHGHLAVSSFIAEAEDRGVVGGSTSVMIPNKNACKENMFFLVCAGPVFFSIEAEAKFHCLWLVKVWAPHHTTCTPCAVLE